MIQQVIRCDICGSQKRQTNHWFIAREESGELRISGWNSLYLQSPETKHLCGETCAHRLISQFLMRLGDVETQPAAEKSETEPAAETEISAPAECALLRPQYCNRARSPRRDLGVVHAWSDRARAPEGEHHD